MTDLTLQSDDSVIYRDKIYSIKSPISLKEVLLEDIKTGKQVAAKIIDLIPVDDNSTPDARENITDLTLISDEDWKVAEQREAILSPLADKPKCSLKEAQYAAMKLNISWRQVYNLIKRYRDYDHQILALLPQQPTGGKGRSRLTATVEQIIQNAIEDRYLTTQQIKISLVVEEIIKDCVRVGIKPPSERTIRRRIDVLSDKLIEEQRRRFCRHASAQRKVVFHSFPEAKLPHQIWQIDHTPVDIIVVDETFRKPIGRPYLTVAIDIFSRCIAGFCLTLEHPSSVSVGLCLTHGVFAKEKWLAERDIKTSWSIWGKPLCIHVDNAKEFHSVALKRGCEVHGIKIEYRPRGMPHYGGIVERVIGTFMQLVHSLPGTTFSNIKERGNYPSEKKAVLTMQELEYWLTIAITDYYHQKLHSGIKLPPIEKYTSAIIGTKEKPGMGYPSKIHNTKAFLIDFLPTATRTLQRHGFMLDHITYCSPALSPLIAERKKHPSFLIRRDPRDLSHIYILEPHSKRYLEIPYRNLSRPTVTLWEHKRAIAWLNNKGICKVNETLIFQAIDRMRELIKAASNKTKSARKQRAKTESHLKIARGKKPVTTRSKKISSKHNSKIGRKTIKPFDDIEIW